MEHQVRHVEEDDDEDRTVVSYLGSEIEEEDDTVMIEQEGEQEVLDAISQHTSYHSSNIDWQLRVNECVQKIRKQTEQLSDYLSHLRQNDNVLKCHQEVIRSFETFLLAFYDRSYSMDLEGANAFNKTICLATQERQVESLNKALMVSIFQELSLEREENIRLRQLIHNWIILSGSVTSGNQSPSSMEKDNETIMELNVQITDELEKVKANARLFDDFCMRQNQHMLHYDIQGFNQQVDFIIQKDKTRKKLNETKLKQTLALNDVLKASLMKMSADKAALVVQHKNLIQEVLQMEIKLQKMASQNSKIKHYSDFLKQKMAAGSSKVANECPAITADRVVPDRRAHTALGNHRQTTTGKHHNPLKHKRSQSVVPRNHDTSTLIGEYGNHATTTNNMLVVSGTTTTHQNQPVSMITHHLATSSTYQQVSESDSKHHASPNLPSFDQVKQQQQQQQRRKNMVSAPPAPHHQQPQHQATVTRSSVPSFVPPLEMHHLTRKRMS